MSINIELSNIPELKELPKMERFEDKGGFAYPDQYVGNIYKYNNKLVFFNEKSMEEASIGMINLLISIINNSSFDNNTSKRQDDLENAFEQFETDVIQLIENIKKDTPEIPQFDPSSIKKELQFTLDKSYKEIKDHIGKQFEENNLDIFRQIESIKNRDDLSDTISSKVDQKLTDVYKNFKSVTESLVKEEVRKIEEEIKSKANKLTVSQIAMFKEMGLSIDNIIELKKNNML